VSVPLRLGKTLKFPTQRCDACPLKAQCTTSKSGRSLSIHPDELLLEELRQRQTTSQGRAQLRQRVAVEHSLAHVGRWQGETARYRGQRKNLFDLRRMAIVHNLHGIARTPSHSLTQAA
jgi:Transposase DDE domain